MIVALVGVAAAAAAGRTIDFAAAGGRAGNFTLEAAWHNGRLLNSTLNALAPGDTLIIGNETFHTMGGILVTANLSQVTVRLDGTLDFSDDIDAWPRTGPGSKGRVLECLDFHGGLDRVTFTSSGTGLMRGNGAKWWGIPGIGYLERQENRPRLFHASSSTGVLLEKWDFVQSPYWTVTFDDAYQLEIRQSNIDNRRSPTADTHSSIEMTAFNTDGFDVTGSSIWIHHCRVWCQDDTFCIKDDTHDVLVEHIEASGVGLTIGSIGDSEVSNITFRNVTMHNTYKGIYTKFRGDGLIRDVLYEDIVMDAPEQWAIWVGPAQQSDSIDLCAAHPCSICWPTDPFSKCNPPANATYQNITLRNIAINSPKQWPGVILANAASPMEVPPRTSPPRTSARASGPAGASPRSTPFIGQPCPTISAPVARRASRSTASPSPARRRARATTTPAMASGAAWLRGRPTPSPSVSRTGPTRRCGGQLRAQGKK